MRHHLLSLPYIHVYITNHIEPGSMTSIMNAPAMSDTIVSAATGRKTQLYFSVRAAEFGAEHYDRNFMVSDLAMALMRTIQEQDLMEDSTGAIMLNLLPGQRKEAEDLMAALPFNPETMAGDYNFYLWVATVGQSWAKSLLNMVDDIDRPVDDAFMHFFMNNPVPGDRIGRANVPGPRNARLNADVYLGSNEDRLLRLASPAGQHRGMRSAKYGDLFPHVVEFIREHHFSETSTGVRRYTAVFYFPFEGMGEWFAEGVLADAVNEAITLSTAGVNFFFNAGSINPDPSVEDVTISSNLAQAARKVDEIFNNSETSNQLVVLVLGRAHQGKTHISASIEQHLKHYGFTGVTVMDQEDSDEMRLQMAKSVENGQREALLMDQPIALLEVNMSVPFKQQYRFE